MEISFAVDWLSMTLPNGTQSSFWPAFNFGYPPDVWQGSKGKNGYTEAVQHPFGMIAMRSADRPDMGTHLSCSGRSLKEMAKLGVSGLALVKWARDARAGVSRIDLAIDVRGVEIDLPALFACEVGKPKTGKPRQQSIVQGKESGCTVYIGSRSSDKFMRAYDKKAESGFKGDVPWYRFELEVKGKAAKALCAQLAGMSEGDALRFTQGLIRGHWDVLDAQYQAIMSADAQYVVGEKNTEHDRLTWLMQTCAKSLAKTIAELPHINVWDEFHRQVEVFYRDIMGDDDLTGGKA